MQKVEQKKVVIVTGGATGIGAACVRYFGERGWQVVVNYFLESDQSTAEALAGECSGIAVRGDVSHDADCRHIAHSALTAFGRIDALVSSAGATRVVAHANLDSLTLDDFLHTTAVNTAVAVSDCARVCTSAGCVRSWRHCDYFFVRCRLRYRFLDGVCGLQRGDEYPDDVIGTDSRA